MGREAWNRGDLATYMNSYWRDEHTRHIFNEDITVGYSAIEERYQSRYPDSTKMGTIHGLDLNVQIMGPAAAVAFGRWRFERGDIEMEGVVTLVLRKTNDKWVIVHDHSTAYPQ